MILSAHQGLLGRQKVTTTEVEYLEGDGSAFICIPYQAQMGDIVSVEYQRVDRNSAWVFGARHDSSNAFGFAFQHARNNDNLSRQSLHVHSGSYTWYSAWLSGANVQMDETSTTIDSTAMLWKTWDGVEKPLDFTQFNYSHGNFGLFGLAAPDGTPWATSSVRIYAFRVVRDGALYLDLIPVRQGKKGFMYDRVSGKLFGNAGTGEFIIGPDK